MLVETQKQVPFVSAMKLSTGEEVIANVVDDKSTHFVVEKPLQMVMSPQGPQFAPFMMMAEMDEKISIFKHLVLSVGTPNPKIEEQYRTVTSTIALPRKQGIIV